VVSEGLDELLELSDRLVVMFHGEFVHEARASEANLTEIGRHMAGIDGQDLWSTFLR
jgi:ABC-type uncharacterized transport system ATPase subunit